jgi:hypothetical protein
LTRETSLFDYGIEVDEQGCRIPRVKHPPIGFDSFSSVAGEIQGQRREKGGGGAQAEEMLLGFGWDSCGGFKEGQGQLVRPIQEDDVAAADALPYKVDNDPRDRVEMDFGLDEVGRWKRPENGLN